jgi:hypothetical protein
LRLCSFRRRRGTQRSVPGLWGRPPAGGPQRGGFSCGLAVPGRPAGLAVPGLYRAGGLLTALRREQGEQAPGFWGTRGTAGTERSPEDTTGLVGRLRVEPHTRLAPAPLQPRAPARCVAAQEAAPVSGASTGGKQPSATACCLADRAAGAESVARSNAIATSNRLSMTDLSSVRLRLHHHARSRWLEW